MAAPITDRGTTERKGQQTILRSTSCANGRSRNLVGTLRLSQGTPMLLAGDEFGRSQAGNNNAYCPDSEVSWLDWDIKQRGRLLIRFTQRLTGLRHKYPILRRARFLNAEYNEELGVKDATWINANGAEMQADDWDDPS